MKMIEKVISGGQTGADIAGLMAAEMYGVETGGCWSIGRLDAGRQRGGTGSIQRPSNH